MIKESIKIDLPQGVVQRLDKYISDREILSRAQIKSRNLKALKDGKELKLSFKVKAFMEIHLEWEEEQSSELEPQAMDLDILYEDDKVLVLNKPQGLVVHPGAGNWTGTLAQGLMHHNQDQWDRGELDSLRPGIVHRLDKDTSGVMITAKDLDSQEYLSEQFRDRLSEKTYVAILRNRPPQMEGSVEGYMLRDPQNRKRFILHDTRGKYSLTHYRVKKLWRGYCLVELKIETGRTHQIRVHCQSLGAPVLGDPIYSRKDSQLKEVGLMLHAWKLGITLLNEDEPREFEAPIPERFDELMERLDRDFTI